MQRSLSPFVSKDGSHSQPFSVLPWPPPLYYRHPRIFLRIMKSKLLISNVTGQSQILILHILLPAVIIPQPLILLASFPFLFISLSVYLIPPSFSSSSPTHIHKYIFSLPLSLPVSLPLWAGSLKTSLSWEEEKVLFCLISFLSPVWRKHSWRLFYYWC